MSLSWYHSLLIVIIVTGLSSCVSAPTTSKSSLATDQVQKFLALVETGCESASDQGWQTASRRNIYGAPICREDNGISAITFQRKSDLILLPVVGGGACSALLPNVSLKDLDLALDEVMLKAGFEELEVIRVTICHPAKCNGQEYCRGSNERLFYREIDNLRVFAA